LERRVFFRIKRSGDRRHLQIVENTRDGAKTRQSVVATPGRVETLQASGKLDALLRSGAPVRDGAPRLQPARGNPRRAQHKAHRRRHGVRPAVIGDRLPRPHRATHPFARLPISGGAGGVRHRAAPAHDLGSGSDRACERWLDAYRVDGAAGLELHHLYRAMTWLDEELADQSGATRAKRRTKDVIEERIFAHRRGLFSDLSVALFDTTSLYFHGAGGETLGQRGKSKDHRPDLKQVIVGVVLDEAGRPICSETWPGNATDVKSLLPVVDRLRERFGIVRMCVVADRGMISAQTIAELEVRGIDYILGARERGDKEVRDIVLADKKPMVPLTIDRARDQLTDIEVKEVVVGAWHPTAKPRRYIVCFNPKEAQRDAAVRERPEEPRGEARGRRQGARRQRRVPPLPQDAAGRPLRDRPRARRRGRALGRDLRAPHQQHARHALRGAGLPSIVGLRWGRGRLFNFSLGN
jgi:Transposase DDE domain